MRYPNKLAAFSIILWISTLFISPHGYAQMKLLLKLQDIPTTHHWDHETDYNETGKWTTDAGTEKILFSTTYSFAPHKTIAQGDKFVFFDYNGNISFTITLDSNTKRITGMSLSNSDYMSKFFMKVDSVRFAENQDSYDLGLSSFDIVDQQFDFDSSFVDNSGSCCRISDWWNFDSTSVPSSLILISIPKALIPTNSIVTKREATASISIFPNPASQDITINVAHPINTPSVSIVNLLGKTQYLFPITGPSEQFKLNLNTIPTGNYLISVSNERQKLTIVH